MFYSVFTKSSVTAAYNSLFEHPPPAANPGGLKEKLEFSPERKNQSFDDITVLFLTENANITKTVRKYLLFWSTKYDKLLIVFLI